MARVVIIGAGLTGLSTAYHLEQKKFFDYVIFEQESEIGGLCRTMRRDGFTFDYTGHFFHSAANLNTQCNAINSVLWHNHARRAFVWTHNRYIPYPYQTNLNGLPTKTIIDCITGFINRKQNSSKSQSFKSWVLKQFGLGFAHNFFLPYQEKIFDFPAERLRTGWIDLIPMVTLEDILSGALQRRDSHNIGYNAQFLYPEQGGIDHLVQAFSKPLTQHIHRNSKIISIDPKNKTVQLSNGHIEHYQLLISTMPISECLIHLGMQDSAKKLLCNRVVNINLGINIPNISDKHWVYYPEAIYPFFRIGFPHTLNNRMAPPGHSSISVEMSSLTPISDKQLAHLKKQAISHIKKMFNIASHNIITEHIVTIKNAYVIYDSWREKNIASMLKTLQIQSIYSIGRYGAWKYASMHDAIKDGLHAANTILTDINTPTFKPAYKSEYSKLTRQTPRRKPTTPVIGDAS